MASEKQDYFDSPTNDNEDTRCSTPSADTESVEHEFENTLFNGQPFPPPPPFGPFDSGKYHRGAFPPQPPSHYYFGRGRRGGAGYSGFGPHSFYHMGSRGHPPPPPPPPPFHPYFDSEEKGGHEVYGRTAGKYKRRGLKRTLLVTIFLFSLFFVFNMGRMYEGLLMRGLKDHPPHPHHFRHGPPPPHPPHPLHGEPGFPPRKCEDGHPPPPPPPPEGRENFGDEVMFERRPKGVKFDGDEKVHKKHLPEKMEGEDEPKSQKHFEEGKKKPMKMEGDEQKRKEIKENKSPKQQERKEVKKDSKKSE